MECFICFCEKWSTNWSKGVLVLALQCPMGPLQSCQLIEMDDPGNITFHKGFIDTTRINYYKGYLKQLKKVVDDGANVEGYFAWSLLDNFEWRLGYTSRFGIVYVDYQTLKALPKDVCLLVQETT